MTTKKRPLSGGKKKEAKDLVVAVYSTPTASHTSALLTEAVICLSKRFEFAQTPDEFSQLYDTLNDTADALSKIKDMTKQRLLSAVTSQGEQVTEKGTRRLTVNNWQIEARPHKTGLDDKKVEALLRAKKLDITLWMDTVITYKASPAKMKLLVTPTESDPTPLVSQDELDTCNVDFTWALQKPKRVSENAENTDNGEYT